VTVKTGWPRRRPAAVGSVVVATVLLAACGGSGSSASSAAGGGHDGSKLTYLINVENTNTPPVLKGLAANECKAQNDALPLQISSIPQGQLDGQIQLLVGQNALPEMFAAAGTPAEGVKLWKAGKLVDFDKVLTELGVHDMIEPGAISTIKKLYGGSFDFLPFQYNVEGIFYNKTLFQQYGVSVPTTWDQLMQAAATFKQHGITPFTASGSQGWPITRLLSGYLFRDLGPNALQDVADGKAKLTDPKYVNAAAQIAALGKQGYLNQDIASLDYDGAENEFLTGKAAMYYMGSWALTSINNASKDKVGPQNVGFMPFPAVTGGAGDISQYPANVGLPSTFGSATLGPKTKDRLKCIVQNFGKHSLVDQNTISGFKVSDPVTTLPALTQDVQKRISESSQTVLWFEALFNAKAGQDSSKNAALLVTGQVSPEKFMSTLQTDLDAG
jgi:raffinose/stachyose/melibiose transport system substrate-binding protein